MVTCHGCSHSLPDEAVFCPECGVKRDAATAVSADRFAESRAHPGPSGALGPLASSAVFAASAPPVTEASRLSSRASLDALLARANLLRMRGQWAEAVERCTEALRADPHNPAAHSLLGDIYENQGRLDKAIHWYQLALEQNPESIADKAKLARARELQAVRRRTGGGRLSWAYLVAVAGVAFLFVAFIMAAIVAADRRDVVVSAVATAPLPEYRVSRAPREQPPDHTSDEEALATYLINELNSTIMSVSGVMLSPGDEEAMVTVEMRDRKIAPDPVRGESPRAQVLRDGYRIAYLARQQQLERRRELRFVTIRALSRLSSGSGPGPVEEIWRGRVDATRLLVRDDQASAAEIRAVFDQLSWNPVAGL